MSRSAAAAALLEPELRTVAQPTVAPDRLMTTPDKAEAERQPPEASSEGRVFAIDRRPLVRSGLAGLGRRALGGGAHGLSDVGQAHAALKLVKSPPRAVLLGIGPGDDPEALIAQARQLGAPVICVLEADDPALARAAIAGDADGYLLLDAARADTVRATLSAVEAGTRVIPPELERFADGGVGAPRGVTERCLEVLRWLADGLHDDEIAGRLEISTSSVRKHIASAQERLEARTRTQVVAMVARNGLL
jgi:DNA-binding NarL/FixJ family response regulator